MGAFIDLSGRQFGRLTVLSEGVRKSSGRRRWACICACGKKALVTGDNLREGKTTSCGCYKNDCSRARISTHGATGTLTFGSWTSMRSRCTQPCSNAWERYGGRGIKVCAEWQDSFERFLADMGERPSKAHSLDRIDPNGHYEPGNCRWALPKEQGNNRRDNAIVTLFGETLTHAQWERRFSLPQGAIAHRVSRGWPVHRAILQPLGPSKGARPPEVHPWG
jgi:hypothetical protein